MRFTNLRRILTVLAALWLLLSAGCSDDAPSSPDCEQTVDCAGDSICVSGQCVTPPGDDAGDAAALDAADTAGDTSFDTRPEDVGGDPADVGEDADPFDAAGADASDAARDVGDPTDVPQSCADPSLTLCGGECVDVFSDPNHCSGCGIACGSDELCEGGQCVENTSCSVQGCPRGTWCDTADGQCKPGCTSDADCYGDDEVCDLQTHECVCAAGFHSCGGSCVSDDSVQTCGSRCDPCPEAPNATAGCSAGACTLTCESYARSCGSSCAVCPKGPNVTAVGCDGEVCVATGCAAGYVACASGCCVDAANLPTSDHIDAVLGINGWSAPVFDTAGHPHAVVQRYRNGQRLTMYYVEWTGQGWAYDELMIGRHPSLALDGQDTPHLVYYDEGTRKITYAAPSASGWATEVVDPASNYSEPEVVLDSQGQPMVIYEADDGQGGNEVRLATRSGGAWTQQTIQGGNIWNLALAVDSQDRPHVAFSDIDADVLYYGVRDSGTWTMEAAYSQQYLSARSVSLQVDSQDRAHLAFVYNHDVYYDGREATGWNMQKQTAIGSAISVSLGLFGADSPVMSIRTDEPNDPANNNSDLGFAEWDGSTWQVDIIEDEYLSGGSNVLAVDAAGQPHILYSRSDGTSSVGVAGTMKYARRTTSGWQVEILEGSYDGGLESRLVLDANERPHVAHLDDNSNAIRYGYWDGNRWLYHTVDLVEQLSKRGNRFGRPALTLDAQGRPHLAFEGPKYDLRYAYWDGSRWVREEVTADFSMEGDVSLALVGGAPHIAYYNSDTSSVIHLRQQASGAWASTTLLTGKPDPVSTDLTVDAAGTLHIALVDGYEVRLGSFDGSAWQFESVEVSAGSPDSVQLVFDSQNRPRLAYIVNKWGGSNTVSWLTYAHKAGGTWSTERVDDFGYYSETVSLDLDAADRPHMVYFDTDVNGLRYATRNGDGWVERILYDNDYSGRTSSMAIDSLGWVHVTYDYHVGWDSRLSYYRTP